MRAEKVYQMRSGLPLRSTDLRRVLSDWSWRRKERDSTQALHTLKLKREVSCLQSAERLDILRVCHML